MRALCACMYIHSNPTFETFPKIEFLQFFYRSVLVFAEYFVFHQLNPLHGPLCYSIIAPFLFENNDVGGAAPTGNAPTTSGPWTILLPTYMRLILEVWPYFGLNTTREETAIIYSSIIEAQLLDRTLSWFTKSSLNTILDISHPNHRSVTKRIM